MTCDRCAKFADLLAERDERIACLEGELGLRANAEAMARLRSVWGVTPAEAQVLMHLHGAQGRLVNEKLIEDALPRNDHATDRSGYAIVKVYVSRLRTKLGRDVIETVWGRGYKITPEGMAKVEAILSPPEIAVAA